jgi:hypothetical protein
MIACRERSIGGTTGECVPHINEAWQTKGLSRENRGEAKRAGQSVGASSGGPIQGAAQIESRIELHENSPHHCEQSTTALHQTCTRRRWSPRCARTKVVLALLHRAGHRVQMPRASLTPWLFSALPLPFSVSLSLSLSVCVCGVC